MRNGKKLCLGINYQFEMDIEEQIRLFRQVGFDGFFTDWNPDMPVEKYKKLADELSMVYQSIHAPFRGVEKMWEEDESAAWEMTEILCKCVRDCAENRVPIMVIHAFKGFGTDTPLTYGPKRFRRVVEEAMQHQIEIAFENVEGEIYLKTLMDEFRDVPNVGFCWDTGHELCYNYGKDMLKFYGNRLICTHFNDNLGIRDMESGITPMDDLHLLPFDGIADWKNIAERVKEHGYEGEITFELNKKGKPGRTEHEKYQQLTTEEYVTAAYQRACLIADMM